MTAAPVIRTALLLATLASSACGPAVLKVESSAPNAIAYLTRQEPAAGTTPTTWLQRSALPTQFDVTHPSRRYWLYAEAPHHDATVLEVRALSRKRPNNLRIEPVPTKRQEYLK